MDNHEGLTARALTPQLWPALEQLFGKNGACGGCWCSYWRIEPGERYDDVKGPTAKRRFAELVKAGRAHGVLAFAGEEPVGWCAFDRRADFSKLDRAPSLRVDDAERVWSLPCFFVKAGWRGQGVAGFLLRAAVEELRALGVELVEAYPTLPSSAGKLPGPWAYTGLPSMFEAAGFTCVQARPKGKQRYRKLLVLDDGTP